MIAAQSPVSLAAEAIGLQGGLWMKPRHDQARFFAHAKISPARGVGSSDSPLRARQRGSEGVEHSEQEREQRVVYCNCPADLIDSLSGQGWPDEDGPGPPHETPKRSVPNCPKFSGTDVMRIR